MEELIRFLRGLQARAQFPHHLRSIEDLLETQSNSLTSPYMIGLYNGLLLAHSLLTNSEYNPVPVPDELLCGEKKP